MKRAAPQSNLDYRLKVLPLFKEHEQRYTTQFVLETTQSFASFVYDLSVKERREANKIFWKVLGLRPPQLSIPASGHATFEREYDGLNGVYDLVLQGLDGRTNTFTLQISQRKVELLRSTKEKFAELVLDSIQK